MLAKVVPSIVRFRSEVMVKFFFGLLAVGWLASAEAADVARNYAVDGAFNRNTVIELAKRLAQSPYKAPDTTLPKSLQNLSYDEYRDIRYKRDEALWTNTQLPFQLQMFHRGLYYTNPVEIALVENGQAHHLPYLADRFSTGKIMTKPLPTQDIGYAGFRLHYPLNRSDYFDEVAVFQGASYFRALGKGQSWGMSARGLTLKTADPQGEEFPLFKAYWIEVPSINTNSIVVHALLDSPSVAGAYRFNIRPGTNTVMDVEATLFPRETLDKVGLGAGTSMYLFSGRDRHNIDDFRPQVHDSDGLLMVNGKGERLWRPLANPATLQISAFVDQAPRGFGLMQRDRHFYNYQDLEATYQRRPSLWVEPIGSWDKGAVTLIEIPTKAEIHDNIVAYWSPAKPIPAGSQYTYAYRLYWGDGPQIDNGDGKIVSTRSGRASNDEDTPSRVFVIDYAIAGNDQPFPAVLPTVKVLASQGKVNHVVVTENPHVHGYRVSFELDPQGASLSELRAELQLTNGHRAETWIYRWTAE